MGSRAEDARAALRRPRRTACALASALPLIGLPAVAWCSLLQDDWTVLETAAQPGPLAVISDAELLAPEPASAPLPEVRAQGEAALADAIQDSEAIRHVLRGLILTSEASSTLTDFSLAPRVSALGGADSTPAAEHDVLGPADRPRGTDLPDRIEASQVIEVSEGITMRGVLRSMVIRARGRSAAGGQLPGELDDSDVDGGDYDGGGAPDFDLRQALLNSHILGLALESVVQVDPVDNSFSIFGVGRFQIELDADAHEAVVSERSSDLSMSVGPGPNLDQTAHQPRQRVERVNLVAAVLQFLESPWGVLALLGGAMLSAMWGTRRIVGSTRRSYR